MNKKVLIFTHAPGRGRAELLARYLQTDRPVECTLSCEPDDLLGLESFDALIVCAAGGALSRTQETALCSWVAGGGAFIGIHEAVEAWPGNVAFGEMLGAQVAAKGPVAPFTVNISDPHHEITRSLGEFRIVDSFYRLERRTKDDLHWLLSRNWHGENRLVACTREFGRGRVFYTALGHDERAVGHPAIQKLIHRALWWATRSNRPGPVRCGVVGYGGSFSMGKTHADTIRNTPGLELTAVCEVDPVRLELASQEQPGIEGFASVAELAAAKAADVAVVVTPHNTHAPITLELLAAGIGVVCEKPFCLTVEEATRMIDAARERKLLLTTFHNRRWDADYLTIRQIIADGLLGDVFHIEVFLGEYKHPGYWWRSSKEVSGGTIYDWGAHFTDWILNLMPHPMESVSGFFGKYVWHDVTNEDHCKAIIRFGGGRSAELEVSHLASVGKPKWRILGTHGGLTCHWESPVHVVTRVHGPAEKIEVPFVETRWASDFYVGLVDHLLGGEPLQVTPESARRVVAVLELAEKASRSGHPEPVPFEDRPQIPSVQGVASMHGQAAEVQ
jgi:scyllo-inositol 2-dehydrogenase (NADP+)